MATWEQLKTAGATESRVRTKVATGEIIRVATGLYRSAHHPHTDRTGVRIAVAIAGGAADRWTALYWHGLIETPPQTVTVTVPIDRRVRVTAGYRVQARRRWLDPLDLTVVAGLRVTRAPLAVLEVCDARVMDRALQQRVVTVEAMARSLRRNIHMWGIVRAREVFAVAAGDTESEAERLFARIMRLHGISGFRVQVSFGRYVLDFAFIDARVAVEINGWAYHRSRDRWMRDQSKTNALAAAGWAVLNFSWHHLTEDPEAVAAEVSRLLMSRAA